MKKRQKVTAEEGDHKPIAQSGVSSIEISKEGIRGTGPWGVPAVPVVLGMLLFAAWLGVRLWS